MKKILIVGSNPQDTNQLELFKEVGKLQEVILRSQYSASFSVELGVLQTQTNLRQYILDIKPQVINFCGHGEKEGLLLEDDQGKVKLAKNEYIADLLWGFADHIECVLLNACDTEPLADEIVQHLNYVIRHDSASF